MRVAVTHFSCYSIVYNVTTSNNRLLFRFNDGTTTQFNVPAGQYDTTSLAAYIDAAVPQLTVTLSAAQTRFSFAAAQNFNLSGFPGSTMFALLGFVQTSSNYQASYVPASLSYVLTSPNLANLGVSRYYSVEASLSSSNVLNADISNSTIARIPITTNYGELNSYILQSPQFTEIQDHVLSALTIRIKDSDGAYVDFQGLSWTMCLFFDETPGEDYTSLLEEISLRQGQSTHELQTDPSKGQELRTSPPEGTVDGGGNLAESESSGKQGAGSSDQT